MYERLFTLLCVMVSVMFFYSSSHGQSMSAPQRPWTAPPSFDEADNLCDAVEIFSQSSREDTRLAEDAKVGPSVNPLEDAMTCV